MRTCPLETLFFVLALLSTSVSAAEEWPGWRGPRQNGVSAEKDLPTEWSPMTAIAWQSELAAEGSSSPIVWGEHVFVTSASLGGERRWLQALDRRSGDVRWTYERKDDNPELSSPLTGHAASTPVTDGEHVFAWFGNAGLVCVDFQGHEKWHRDLGQFETELGLASSPVLHDDQLFVLCDHDGDRFHTFDSFLVALDKHNGQPIWRAERQGLFRSWSTPLLRADAHELVVAGDKQLRSYDLTSGKELWHVDGLLEWVAPTPVADGDLILAMCGRNGPMLAVHGGKIENEGDRLCWQHAKGGPYVCSPLVYEQRLYVHDEQGILQCYDVRTGAELYQQRLQGTFYGSAIAADGYIYITSEQGTTFVLRDGPKFELVAKNSIEGHVLASPAVSRGAIFLRADKRLYCVQK